MTMSLAGFLVTTTVFASPPLVVPTSTPMIYATQVPFAALRGSMVESARTDMTRPVKSTADRIIELRELSGLTTDQIGRLMGVSRRSIHNWIRGTTMSRANEEHLSALTDAIQRVGGSTPEERRARLLDSSGGMSIFHQLAERAQPERLEMQKSPLTVTERMGV